MNSDKLFQKKLLALAILGGVTAALPLVAIAADKEMTQIEEVVVTARHREESLQDVPVSITAVNAENIEQYGARTLSDLSTIVPNFSMDDGLNPTITIRGRKNATRTVGTEAGVGVYVDGVFRTGAASNLDLVGVEQVEVLRGPQGTLYGKNTISGAVNIVTKKPGEEIKGGVGASLGNFGRRDTSAYIEGALMNNLNARLSLSSLKSDGYVQNVVTGKDRGGMAQSMPICALCFKLAMH